MKENTLSFLSQEVFNLSSDEDDVICLDDIPPPTKKIKKAKKSVTRQYSENLSGLVTVRILTKPKNVSSALRNCSNRFAASLRFSIYNPNCFL